MWIAVVTTAIGDWYSGEFRGSATGARPVPKLSENRPTLVVATHTARIMQTGCRWWWNGNYDSAYLLSYCRCQCNCLDSCCLLTANHNVCSKISNWAMDRQSDPVFTLRFTVVRHRQNTQTLGSVRSVRRNSRPGNRNFADLTTRVIYMFFCFKSYLHYCQSSRCCFEISTFNCTSAWCVFVKFVVCYKKWLKLCRSIVRVIVL